MRLVGKCMVAAAMLLAVTSARAQQGPCADDVAKLCKDVQPGEGRVLQCLKTNQAQVSSGCKTYLKEVKQQVKAACEPDVEKFCSDVKPGKGALMKCLKSHAEELSPDCKAMAAKAKGKKGKH